MRLIVWFACAAAVAAVAACGSPSADRPSILPTTVGPATPIAPQPTPVDTADMSIDPTVADIVSFAVADLAGRLGVDEGEIEVIKAEQVTWPDGSMGCPQPGVMYTMALVEGAQVILAVDSRTRVFDYHAGSDGQAFLCPSREPDGGHDFVPPPGFDT